MAEERIPEEYLEFKTIGGSPKPIDTRTGEIGGEKGRIIRQSKISEEFKKIYENNKGDARAAIVESVNILSSKPIKTKIADADGKGIETEISISSDAKRKLKNMVYYDKELAFFAAHYEDVITHGEYMGRREQMEKEESTSAPSHESKFEAFHYWKGTVTALVPPTKENPSWHKETRDIIIDVGEKNTIPHHAIYTAKHSLNPTFAKKEADIRKYAKKISEDKAIYSDLVTSDFHSIASNAQNITMSLEIVNIRFVPTKAKDSAQAALDHFCRRIAALGMDVFSVSKGAGYAEEQYKRLLEENGNGTK